MGAKEDVQAHRPLGIMIGQDPEKVLDLDLDIELFLELADHTLFEGLRGLFFTARKLPEAAERIPLPPLGNEEFAVLKDQRRAHFQNGLSHKETSDTKSRSREERCIKITSENIMISFVASCSILVFFFVFVEKTF